jgi:peptidyl-prolyl cis-trans isomerase C
LGSAQALADWKAKYGYDDATFRKALSRSVAAAWMRDQIAATVPKTAEQVHIRQILLYNSAQADEIYQQLQAGNSFENLALKYDPITGGDLGWFPKGYLPDKEIEDAAFSLQPEQYSAIIKTSAGYHILQLLERDPARPLSPDALLALQTSTVASWIEQQRANSQVEILLPS